MSLPRLADVFCGVGMNSIAFGQAGFTPVFACDIDPDARAVYLDNLGLAPGGDVALVDPRDVPDHEVAVASSPCQPHSNAGLRQGLEDGRSAVLYSLFSLLARKAPAAVVVENVAGMRTYQGGRAFRLVKETLGALGYRVSWRELRACDFGGAQIRRRVFIVGSRRRRFDFDALARKPVGRISEILHPEIADGWLGPGEYVLLDRPRALRSGAAIVGYRFAAPRRPGGDPCKSSTHYEYNWIYDPAGLGPTLTTTTNTRFLVEVGGRVRRVTLPELQRFMGLPGWFRFRRPSEAHRLLGNGVYVPLVAELARQVAAQLFGVPGLRDQARSPPVPLSFSA